MRSTVNLRAARAAAILAALLILVATRGWAKEATFAAELGTDAAKVVDDVDLSMMNGNQNGVDSGRGPVPYYKGMGTPPKRVALVSFYVWDCGNKKESAYTMYGGNYTYRVKNTRTIDVNAEATEMLANELLDAGIGPLKSAFASVGMQLLTPEEFADTDEKKEAYANAQIKVGGVEKFVRWLQGQNWASTGVASGYRLIQLTNAGDVKGNQFRLLNNGVGVADLAQTGGHDFAKALGVDAIVILYNVVQGQKNAIRMRGAYMYMFGPNPVPDTGQSLYWRGHQYSGVYLRMDAPFITTDKKGNLIEADYEGYAIVANAIGTRMAQHLQEKIQGK